MKNSTTPSSTADTISNPNMGLFSTRVAPIANIPTVPAMTASKPNNTGSPGEPFRTCSRTIAALLRVMSNRYHTAIIYGRVSVRFPRRGEVRQTVNSMPPGPLFVAEGFLTQDECQACTWAMDAGRTEEAEVLGEGSEPRLDVRRAQHIEVAPAVLALVEERLDACRERIAAHFGLHLTVREGSGFVRYPQGGFYAPHVDWSDSPGWPDAARRQVAVVVFLASSTAADPAGAFDGGILRLFPDGGPDAGGGGCAEAGNAGRVSRHAAPRGHRGAARRAGRDCGLVLLRGWQFEAS